MKYAIATDGTMKMKTAVAVKSKSAIKAASTLYELFAFSCLNNALHLLRWYP